MLPKTLVTAAPDGAQDAGINAAKVGRRLARSRSLSPPPLSLCPCLSEGTITEHCSADTALVFIH